MNATKNDKKIHLRILNNDKIQVSVRKKAKNTDEEFGVS